MLQLHIQLGITLIYFKMYNRWRNERSHSVNFDSLTSWRVMFQLGSDKKYSSIQIRFYGFWLWVSWKLELSKIVSGFNFDNFIFKSEIQGFVRDGVGNLHWSNPKIGSVFAFNVAGCFKIWISTYWSNLWHFKWFLCQGRSANKSQTVHCIHLF